MLVWEYKVVLASFEVDPSRGKSTQKGTFLELDSVGKILNSYGREGWELVSVGTTQLAGKEHPLFYLKRQLKTTDFT